MLFITNIALTFLVVLLALVLFWKTLRHRKKALIVLNVRPTIKLLAPLIAFLFMIVNYPQSLYFFGYTLSFVLVPFSTDIVVEDDGVYFGLKLLPWDNIEKISDHRAYLMLITNRKFDRKAFLKIIWKINYEDITKIESLWKNKNVEIASALDIGIS